MDEKDFWEQVDKGKDCWQWHGTTNGKGYGVYKDAGKLEYAHRLAFLELVGTIRTGQKLYNTCLNRRCVNPAHWQTDKPIPYRGMQYKAKKGGKNGNFKLSDAQVQAIRQIADNSQMAQAAIAARYRISQAQVSRILSGVRR